MTDKFFTKKTGLTILAALIWIGIATGGGILLMHLFGA